MVRLKMFEWIKFLRRHLHQIQGNWVEKFHNCLAWECKNAEVNLKSTSAKGIQLSNNKFINGGGGGYAWPGLTVITIYVKQCLRVVSSSAKFIVRKLISSKHSTVETVLGTHRATSLADNYSNSKSPPRQSNNMDQSDWRSFQLRPLKKKKRIGCCEY